MAKYPLTYHCRASAEWFRADHNPKRLLQFLQTEIHILTAVFGQHGSLIGYSGFVPVKSWAIKNMQ
jgi:hypothetical protein